MVAVGRRDAKRWLEATEKVAWLELEMTDRKAKWDWLKDAVGEALGKRSNPFVGSITNLILGGCRSSVGGPLATKCKQ